MKPYSRLVELVILYLLGIIAVAVVLAWSLLIAWAIFLGLTALIFFIAFRTIFPASMRDEAPQRGDDWSVAVEMRELESMIRRGFEDKDLQAQRKTLETLAKILARKVKIQHEMSETDIKTLIRDPESLRLTLGEPELVQLLGNGLKASAELWDLGRLGHLIDKVEDWRK